jgi:predicted Rossmann fold flavoprotein
VKTRSVYDAIIIGGGAAGLFGAAVAGRRGKRVLVIENNAEVGRKILISGGGRCNFTNLNTGPENFISSNPHFCKSALAQFTPADFVALVKKHKIAFYEKKLGQLFCRESSRQIVDMLLAECRQARAKILTGQTVSEVSKTDDDRFMVETSMGRFEGRNLVVASGGLSFPKIGATDIGYRIARNFGLKTVNTRPSLVALVFAGERLPSLAGISADAVVRAGKTAFRENILFTHRGLSGPAVLQISNYWSANKPVIIDLLPEVGAEKLTQLIKAAKTPSLALTGCMPDRLAAHFSNRFADNERSANLSGVRIEQLVTGLKEWNLRFRDTEGYDRAEVTLGGVSTDELNSKTMESRRIKGLYFIGEVVDVTGWLGGYNFQWAWSSGFAAGNAI